MNYISVLSGIPLDVVFEGYSLNYTNFLILSSSDSTKTVPFCSFKPDSTKFSIVSGTPYFLYNIVSENIISVTLSGIKFLGIYDLIIFNDSGYIKLSDKGYLIDYRIPNFTTPTPTPSITVSLTPTIPPSMTPTLTPTITPTITTNLYSGGSNQSINEVNNIIKNLSNPVKDFTNFSILCTIGLDGYCNDFTNQKREWNPNFWGYPYRDILNFSGVSLNSERNATLITPQHFISNTHFSPSVSCCFFDHNTGEPVFIRIADYRNFGEDSYIGKLETPVPSISSIKIYKIAASDYNIPFNNNSFPIIYIGGKAFYNQSCFHGGCIGSTSQDPFSGALGNRAYLNSYSTSLTNISSCFIGKDFSSNGVVTGESSSPYFILFNNELLLYGSFYTATYGPWWGGYNTLIALSSRIIQMGNPNNYSLSAVYLNRI